MSKWIMSVRGRRYGPYTAAQMQGFAIEGRLAGHSLVSKEDEGNFRPASEDPDIGYLFRPATAKGARPFGHNEGASNDEPGHFLIVADMKSSSVSMLGEEIAKIGPSQQILPQAWVLTCELPLGTLRNLLVQNLGKLDTVVVVDATNDKLTWSNLGLEAEIGVRRIWAKQPQLSAA